MQNIKEYVAAKKEALAEEVKKHKKIKMAVVQVGHVPASDRYVRNKISDCESVGIDCDLYSLEETISEGALLKYLDELNSKRNLTGYLVQLPLPSWIDEEKVKLKINPTKDIDGFHPMSSTVPATPLGIYRYLKDQGFQFSGKNAVVIGRSNIVGRPMARLLLDESMNVSVIHSKTSESDKKRLIKNADLIVVATGHLHTLTKDYEYKKTATVIDVGINVMPDGKLCGDCDKELPVAFQSPVPGGVGLLTRLAVIDNLLKLATK